MMIGSSRSADQNGAGAKRMSRSLLAICAVGVGFIVGANFSFHAEAQMSMPGPANETPFLAENATAMDRMMKDMAVRPTGDVDHDFVEMMVPHHQGAIDMAKSFLRYGHNEQLRRLAQEIIVTQQQEIVTMRLALGQPLPTLSASPNPKPDADPAMSHDSTMKK
jgi:uncharacterized protein (DUF305 family)